MIDKTEILISIITPVYKVEDQINRCMQSLINQTHRNIEIILVDDGSPDNCPRICDEYALKDKRVRVIHKGNGGLSDARNVGLKMARGEYIMYVDSDDYIELDACERLLEGIDEDVDLVAGACKEIHETYVIYQRHSNLESGRKYSSKEFAIESIKQNEWYAPAWLFLYNRLFLVNNGLYFKKGYLYEDMEMLPRLFLAAKTVVYIDYCFYNYVIRPNSIMSSEINPERTRMRIDIFDGWLKLLKEVEDKEYQRYLYGVMIRYYLAAARRTNITKWEIQGMNVCFALKYAIGIKDKLKVIFFTLFPWIYVRILRKGKS